jgi:hypothetical protein
MDISDIPPPDVFSFLVAASVAVAQKQSLERSAGEGQVQTPLGRILGEVVVGVAFAAMPDEEVAFVVVVRRTAAKPWDLPDTCCSRSMR